MRLLGKIMINGRIEALTGIAIGGSDADIMIGGIDTSIIKNAEGIPFIPGSSLKGKLIKMSCIRFIIKTYMDIFLGTI